MSRQKKQSKEINNLYQEARDLRKLGPEEVVLPERIDLAAAYNDHNVTKQEMRRLTADQIYNDMMAKIKSELQDSYIYKRKKLHKIMELCAPEDSVDVSQLDPDFCIKAFSVAIKAIDISNKMEGHYPRESAELRPEKSEQDLQQMRELADRLVIEHKSEY